MTTETTLLHLKPAQIKLHPDNPRDDVGDVTDLANSIGEVGLLEPVVVAPPHDALAPKAMGKAEYLLIAGHRRLAASQKAGVKQVPAIFRADLTSRAQQIEAMLVENLHRADLSAIEEANGYQLLLDITGLTQAKVAEHVGQPVKRVRERLKLTRLPNGIQTRVHDGQITLADAQAFVEISAEPDLVKEVEKFIGSSDFSWSLKRAQDTAGRRARFRADKAAVQKAGIVPLDEAPETWRPDSTLTPLSRLYRDLDLNFNCTAADVLKVRDQIPGLAVYFDSRRQSVDWYCDKPEPEERAARGIDDTDLPQTPEELDARRQADERWDAEERARDELKESLDAAAAVRMSHVGDVLRAKGNDDLAKRLLIRWLLQEGNDAGLHWPIHGAGVYGWPSLANMLGIPVDHPRDDRQAVVESKLDRLPLAGLVLIVATWWSYDSELTGTTPFSERGTHYDDEPVADWVNTLTDDLGYQWSDLERTHLSLDADGHFPTDADEDDDE